MGCGMQSSSYSAMTMSAGSIEQAGHCGSRSIRYVRNDCSSESYASRRPDSVSPMPRISLIASTAWIEPDDPRQHGEHARLGARRRQLGRRRLGQEAAVARAVVGREHRGLALEPEDRAVHDRDADLEGGVVEQVAHGEVVGAVDHDVVARQDVDHVVGPEAHVVGDHVLRRG